MGGSWTLGNIGADTNGNYTLVWDDPQNPEIAKWQYRKRNRSEQGTVWGNWGDWTDIDESRPVFSGTTVGTGKDKDKLTFNTSNWNTAQDVEIKLKEDPTENVTLTLAKPGVVFVPSPTPTPTPVPSPIPTPTPVTLDFTGGQSGNWNTAQTVHVTLDADAVHDRAAPANRRGL